MQFNAAIKTFLIIKDTLFCIPIVAYDITNNHIDLCCLFLVSLFWYQPNSQWLNVELRKDGINTTAMAIGCNVYNACNLCFITFVSAVHGSTVISVIRPWHLSPRRTQESRPLWRRDTSGTRRCWTCGKICIEIHHSCGCTVISRDVPLKAIARTHCAGLQENGNQIISDNFIYFRRGPVPEVWQRQIGTQALKIQKIV